MTTAKSDPGEQAATVEAIRGRSAARQAKLRAAKRGTIGVVIGSVVGGIASQFVQEQRQKSAPVRALATAFHREWTPRAYTWTADQPTPAQPNAQLQPLATTPDPELFSAMWLSGPQWPWGAGDGMDFARRQTAAWREAPLRARTLHIQALGGHPLGGLLAEQLFLVLRDNCDFDAVRLFPPGGEPVGGDAPDVDLYVCVDRAEVTRAKGRTKVDVDVRFEASGGAPGSALADGEPSAARAWSRAVRNRWSRWVHAEVAVEDGIPLWRLVAAGLADPVAHYHDTRHMLEKLGVLHAMFLHAPPTPPVAALLPYEPTPVLPWPDGAVTQQVSSRRRGGCANETLWTIAASVPADEWRAAVRERFVAAGWQPVAGAVDGTVALRRGDESFVCEVAPAAFARGAAAAMPQWLPAAPGAAASLRAMYRKGLSLAAAGDRLAAAPAPTKEQLAWAALAFERLPASWQQAVAKAPLADYAGALPWPALVTVAKAQAAAGDRQAARATMGAAFVQAQLATAFEPMQESERESPARSALDRFDAAWRAHAEALGLPATPPTVATAADVAAVGGAVVPADAVDGSSEVHSRDGFMWLAARADRPGFAAFWFNQSMFSPDSSAPSAARTDFVVARRHARGFVAPTILLAPRLKLDCTDFAGRAPRHMFLDVEGGEPSPSGLRATVVDDERLRVRAAR